NRFVELLKQAHKARTLNEEYLVTLQNATVTNNYVKAYSFRTDQNYLSSGQRGAIGVSYIPPPPSLANELMNQLLMLVNQPPKGIDPIVLATIVSFAFVYIHPFMDGNGRLSRFLFHYVLCQMGGLKNGLLLPVSAVLRKDEIGYKAALESWSSKIRDYWNIIWFDRSQLQLDLKGPDSHWDATSPVTYMFCMELRVRISVNRRKQYKDRVPAELFDFIEELYIATKQKH
ncbi:MAG: Fic family protein, partial [Leptonema sp. (in: Bacteria)]|nr:Fic family protein [Leptonema sp. (in: bacteria)]